MNGQPYTSFRMKYIRTGHIILLAVAAAGYAVAQLLMRAQLPIPVSPVAESSARTTATESLGGVHGAVGEESTAQFSREPVSVERFPAGDNSDAAQPVSWAQSLDKQFGERQGDLIGQGKAGTSASKVIVPSSAEQRRDFAERTVPVLAAQVPEVCSEIIAGERARLTKTLRAESRHELEAVLASLSDSELGYRLELNDAIRKEILEGDLASAVKPSKDRPGVIGTVSTSIGKSEIWGDGGVAKVTYFIEFSKHERVAAADRQLTEVRQRVMKLEVGKDRANR